MHQVFKSITIRASLIGALGLASSPTTAFCDGVDPSKRRPGVRPELYKIKYKAGQAASSTASSKEHNDKSEVKKDFSEFLIMSGTTNTALAKSVCKLIGTTPTSVTVDKFSDGEISCCINESVRGKDVYLFQSFGEAVNDNIMELLLTVAALRRAGAGTITAVIPYYGYKFHRNRGMPISTTFQSRFLWNAAGDIAKMLKVCGVDKVLSVDLQRPGQNHEACFFDGRIPAETIDSNNLFIDYIKESHKFDSGDRVVVVSPNTEFVKKARRFQRKLQEAVPDIDVGYAAFLDDDINNMTIPLSRHKRLEKANSRKLQPQSKDMSSRSISTDLEEEGESSSSEDKQDIQEVLADMDRTDKQTGVGSGNLNTATSKSFMSHAGIYKSVSFTDDARLMGDVRDANVIIIDEIMESSAGLSALCRRLVRQGAKKIMVCASHGVFSAESMRIIDLSVVDEVVVTDSLPLPKNIHVSKKIRQVSVAPLLAKIIETELFNQMGVVTSGGDDVSGDNDDDNEFEEVS